MHAAFARACAGACGSDAGLYVYGANFSDVCPTGYRRPATEPECQLAAAATGGAYQGQIARFDRPRGCHKFTSSYPYKTSIGGSVVDAGYNISSVGIFLNTEVLEGGRPPTVAYAPGAYSAPITPTAQLLCKFDATTAPTGAAVSYTIYPTVAGDTAAPVRPTTGELRMRAWHGQACVRAHVARTH